MQRGRPGDWGSGTVSQIPTWLAITQSIATTGGVLLALYVAIWREPRKAQRDRLSRDEQAQEDRRRYDDQMAALQRAEDDRIAAQARKVVSSVNRAEMFGENIWIARVMNTSTGAINHLTVAVAEIGSDGKVVPNGAQPGNDHVDIAGGMEHVVSEAISGAMSGMFGGGPFAQMIQSAGGGQNPFDTRLLTRAFEQRIGPEVMKQVQEAMSGQLATEWPTTLGPNQPAVMAYRSTMPGAELRIAIEYEDESGYRWQRVGGQQPIRVTDETSSTDV